ncbi:MAG: serine protease [Candidatus Omnitrophota bacterium]|jgi:S1-C subfamily serine protease
MKYILTIILALSFIKIGYTGDQFVKAEYVTFVGIEQYSNVIKKTVFCVQIKGDLSDKNTENDWISMGSGFLVKGENGIVYGLTCAHVIKDPFNKKQAIYIGLDTDKSFKRFPCVVDYFDEINDFAILKPQQDKNDKVHLENLTFDINNFASKEELIEGRALIIPGYPLGIGASNDQNHPVIRIGIIAQYAGAKYFLIDGVANHGNSGSPVFLLKEKKVAGMITSYISDYIALRDENSNISAKLPYNSGLGKAIASAEFIEVFKKLTRNEGNERNGSGTKN